MGKNEGNLPCETCGALPGEGHKITTPHPDDDQISWWVFDSVCDATDGCQVEPDGICPHGHHSWLLQLGLV